MDGIELSSANRTKKGRITAEMLTLYDLYHEQLQIVFCESRFEILRCETHQGFAFAVQHGLQHCSTTYAVVAQHDRVFTSPFNRLNELIHCMETYNHIRYIGFPSSSNVTHDRLLATTLNLNILNSVDQKYFLGQDLYLQPLVFWFDSNHLCHVQRYLEIYTPISRLPTDLKARIGMSDLKKLVLRKGDFIEDRFGQMQRILITAAGAALSAAIAANSAETNSTDRSNTSSSSNSNSSSGILVRDSEEYVIRLFRWFGSYLCWESAADFPFDPAFDQNKCVTRVMVQHLKGRQRDPQRIQQYRQQGLKQKEGDAACGIVDGCDEDEMEEKAEVE